MTPSSYFDINLRFLTIRKSHCNIGLSQVVYKPGRLYLPFCSILTSSVMSKKESRLQEFVLLMLAANTDSESKELLFLAKISEAAFFHSEAISFSVIALHNP